ncbi:MAG: hypothetical protein LBR60_00520 [Fibrobacter sp.]|nr:hypothetical protein [Fibrobacter sp.]
MKRFFALSLFLLLCIGCAGTSKDPEQINEALVGFTVNVQASRWEEALQFVTPGEAKDISTPDRQFKPEYQAAAHRLPLTALKRMEWTVDGKGRLVGIKEVMDESNRRYLVSEEQKLVGSDLEAKREERIRRRLEEGQRLKNETPQQEQEVQVMSNKLTEEEKRKYGSTGELRAPDSTFDEPAEDDLPLAEEEATADSSVEE